MEQGSSESASYQASDRASKQAEDTFCEECFLLLTQEFAPDEYERRHKESYALLEQSIAAGCQLCAIMHDGWLRRAAEYCDRSGEEIVQEILSHDRSTFEDTPIHVRSWIVADMDHLEFGLTSPGPLHYDEDWDRVEWNNVVMRSEISLVKGRVDAICGRLIPRHVDLEVCRRWLMDCAQTHAECPRLLDQELPKRVIDVGPADGSRLPRIILGGGIRATYVALSHCWGDTEIAVTKSDNVESRLSGIEWSSLPKTFQDAIHVVRTLGFRYLWIDSLCIVQDDPIEWEEQCPKMVSIYSNAFFTIAASGAENASEGFLRERIWPLPRFLKLRYSEDDEPAIIAVSLPASSMSRELPLEEDSSVQVSAWLNAQRAWAQLFYVSRKASVEDPPVLARRAWALQERLLSPRILHFGSKQAYFECDHSHACEGYRNPSSVELKGARPRKSILRAISYILWYELVTRYTKCNLTYGDDLLPALAGLARLFGARLSDDYCSGLWKNDMFRGLQWRVKSAEQLEPPRSAFPAQKHLPSWSWASCDYPVSWNDFSQRKPLVEILDLNSLDPLDRSAPSRLVIQGKLTTEFAVYTSPSPGKPVQLRDIATGKFVAGHHGGRVRLDKPRDMEFGLPLASIKPTKSRHHVDGLLTRKVYCLFFSSTSAAANGHASHSGSVAADEDASSSSEERDGRSVEFTMLILEKVESDNGVPLFRRVGFVERRWERRLGEIWTNHQGEDYGKDDYLGGYCPREDDTEEDDKVEWEDPKKYDFSRNEFVALVDREITRTIHII